MSKLLFDEAPLVIDVTLAKNIGLNEAIVVQQINYWIEINRKKNTNFHEGCFWTYNSIKEWNEHFPFFGERTLQRIFNALKKLEILKTGNFNKAKFDKTLWYTIDYEKLVEIVEGVNPLRQNGVIEEQENVNDNDKMAKRERQNGKTQTTKWHNEDDNLAKPIPEITTETTTEITTETTDNINKQSEIVCGTEAPQAHSKQNIELVITEWNANKYTPKIHKLVAGTERYNMLNCRIKQYGLDAVIKAVRNISQSNFLQGLVVGSNGKVFNLTFDWFVRPNNFPKILEGNYSNKGAMVEQEQVLYEGNGYTVEAVTPENKNKNAFDKLREKYGE